MSEFSASKIRRVTDKMRQSRTDVQVEPARNPALRFLGQTEPEETHDAVEVREDARLLVSIGEGNQHALAVLYRRRGGLLYSLLVRMLVSETEAQEVMQDTFVRVWRRAREYDARRSSPIAWMIMIARGLAMDRLRDRARRSTGRTAYAQEVASLAVEEMNGARQAERDELAVACSAALHSLPEPQERALQLAFFRGWSHEEIASVEGEPLGTIKARIRRGLLALRRTLRDYHG